MDAITMSAAGMQAADARLYASAQRVAAGPNETTEYASEAVEQISAKQQFRASAAVVKTADQMLKALLDILA